MRIMTAIAATAVLFLLTAPTKAEPEILSSIAAGGSHSCGITSSGKAKCWGDNFHGQLGDGTQDDSTLPIPVKRVQDAVAVTAGFEHTCVALAGGSAKCWGGGGSGRLGLKAVPVQNVSNATAISTGDAHTCAIDGSTVKCWGNNGNGQIGDGTFVNRLAPVDVAGIGSSSVGDVGNRAIANAVSVAAGGAHSCAVLATGRVKCWGLNDSGQLGNGTNTRSSTPVNVRRLTDAIAIAAGNSFTCALTLAGRVKCWGDNSWGQLGNGTQTASNVPVNVKRISDAVAIAAAGLLHACALLQNGRVSCWGFNGFGRLGDGTQTFRTIPVRTLNFVRGTAIAVGRTHTCGIQDNGRGKCWGANGFGQVGNGATAQGQLVPDRIKRMQFPTPP